MRYIGIIVFVILCIILVSPSIMALGKRMGRQMKRDFDELSSDVPPLPGEEAPKPKTKGGK